MARRSIKHNLILSARIAAWAPTQDRRNGAEGYHKPGAKPGYVGCNTLPNGGGKSKGMPSATMARLRLLAKTKNGEHGRHGFR